MKKIIFITNLLVSLFAFSFGEINPNDLITRILAKLSPSPWSADFAFVNIRTDGSKYEYSVKVSSMDSKKTHLIFTAPPRDAGRQILNLDGEIWSYLPDSRKIVRLANRDSIGNGDFNNTDVLQLNWLDFYVPTISKETEKQIVIDMKAIPEVDTAYYLVRLWVQKSDEMPLQQYFYDKEGHHLKSLKYGKPVNFNGVTRPSVLLMENVITGQKTMLTYLALKPNDKLPESRFRQENLGK